MTGPIIPADQWPEGAVAMLWSAFGFGKWIVLDSFTGTWELERADIHMPDGWDWRVPVMRTTVKESLPVATASDLEQFRETVERVWKASHVGSEDDLSLGKLLALIDGQASPHPEGTPMMPSGRFYDSCWKLAPEGVRHHARMLTQSWRAADSSELKRALEAGVLALIDGQAKCQTCGTAIKPHPLTGTICDCALQPTKGEEVSGVP